MWCLKKPGQTLRDEVENKLAWQRVKSDLEKGVLGEEFDRAERAEVQANVENAHDAAADEVWASYRFIVLADPATAGVAGASPQEADGLKVIDLGAGHSSATETLCGRVISALKSQALLNESVGAGYIERHWPPALKESAAWPLAGLRQSFLNGALTRLLDPDTVLRGKIVEFVEKGDFGLASGPRPDGSYDHIWYHEPLAPEEVAFEAGVFLLMKAKAQALKAASSQPPPEPRRPETPPEILPKVPQGPPEAEVRVGPGAAAMPLTKTLHLVGRVPPELWNRLGTKVIPKLRSGSDLQVGIEFTVSVNAEVAPSLVAELKQILADLGVTDDVQIEVGQGKG
jgi:hypothetical protein